MSLFNYIHVHRENQDSSILYPLKSIRSMGYIYIQKTQEAVSSRFMIEQVFFTQSFTWSWKKLQKKRELFDQTDIQSNYWCFTIAGLGFTTRHATVDSNLPCIDLFFLISKVLLSRTSTSFYLNWHNRDEDYRLYRRHTNLCQFPLILFIWNITTVIGYDNKEKLVRFQRKP